MKRIVLFAAFLLLALNRVWAQKKYAVYAVGFYNLENLFDTKDDPNNKGDDEFLPDGPYHWTQEKYHQKLRNLAHVIYQLGEPYCPAGVSCLGAAEIENDKVLRDLINTEPLKSRGLKYVHYESPDHRGIDVALLYNPRLFTVLSSKPIHYVLPDRPDFHTRDILLVCGKLAGERVDVLVNHWPSRYGGASSSPLREHAAALCKRIADSVRAENPRLKVIIVGDLNDDPKDVSVSKVLGAARTEKATPRGGYFNATWPLYDRGIGSLCYQNVWCLYDQQIISANLLSKNRSQLSFWKAEVFNKPFITDKIGKRKGYPLRSFQGGVWLNGYSDHFPTVTYYVKELKQ